MSVGGFRFCLIAVAAVLIACSGAAQSFNLRLSLDSTQDPIIQRCLADASGRIPRATDDEPFIAADPSRPGQAVAIWQTRSGAGSVIQWSQTADDGRTWSPP